LFPCQARAADECIRRREGDNKHKVIIRPRHTFRVSGLFLQVEFLRFSVGQSVCPSAGNDYVFWKNGGLDRDAVWGREWG